VTDRLTDHATRSVTIGRIYVRSTAMRPNKSQHLQQQTDNINFGDDVYIILQKVRMAQRIQQNIA